MLKYGEVIIGVIVKSSEPVAIINRDDGGCVDKFYEVADLMCLNINTGELFPAGTVDIDDLYNRHLYSRSSVKEEAKRKYIVLKVSLDNQIVIGGKLTDYVDNTLNYLVNKDDSFPIFDSNNNLIGLTGDNTVSICVSNYGYTLLDYKDYSLFSNISLDRALTRTHNPFIGSIEVQDTDYFREVSSSVWISNEDCYVDGDVRELVINEGIKRVVILKDTVKHLVLSKTVDAIRAKYINLRLLSRVYISKEANLSCICHLISIFNEVCMERFEELGLNDTDLMDTIYQCMVDKNYEYMWEYCNREENQDEMAEILSNVEIIVY